MTGKVPPDAFQQYLALGNGRSYQQLADNLGVSKQAIVKRATAERWQERLEAIEDEARARTDKKAVETLEELNDRWLRMWGIVEKRSLESLRNTPMASAMDAVRALDLAHKNARLIRGQATERVETIETVIKREYAHWLEPVPETPEAAEPEETIADGTALDDQQDRAVS